jgi:hypothetical protein
MISYPSTRNTSRRNRHVRADWSGARGSWDAPPPIPGSPAAIFSPYTNTPQSSQLYSSSNPMSFPPQSYQSIRPVDSRPIVSPEAAYHREFTSPLSLQQPSSIPLHTIATSFVPPPTGLSTFEAPISDPSISTPQALLADESQSVIDSGVANHKTLDEDHHQMATTSTSPAQQIQQNPSSPAEDDEFPPLLTTMPLIDPTPPSSPSVQLGDAISSKSIVPSVKRAKSMVSSGKDRSETTSVSPQSSSKQDIQPSEKTGNEADDDDRNKSSVSPKLAHFQCPPSLIQSSFSRTMTAHPHGTRSIWRVASVTGVVCFFLGWWIRSWI